MHWDRNWYLEINDFARHTPWLHGVAAAYALWGGLVALAALLIATWWTARQSREPASPVALAVLTGMSTVVSVLANQALISPVFARQRPCRTQPGVEVLLRCGTDYSLPSDHCIIAGAFVAGLWLTGRRNGAVATGLALLLAFTRVYTGVHYPLDTVTGLLTGALICTVIVTGLRLPATALANALTATRLRGLITSARRVTPAAEPGSPAPLGQRS